MADLRTDVMRMARRNKLVGIWAAEKMALTGDSAIAYSNELAMRALDLERNDLLAIIHKDFEAAGVIQSDEQILNVMNLSLLEAGKQTQRADASDVALVQIARNLSR